MVEQSLDKAKAEGSIPSPATRFNWTVGRMVMHLALTQASSEFDPPAVHHQRKKNASFYDVLAKKRQLLHTFRE